MPDEPALSGNLRSRALLMEWLVAEGDESRAHLLETYAGPDVAPSTVAALAEEYLAIAQLGPSYEAGPEEERLEEGLLTLVLALGTRCGAHEAVSMAEGMLEGARQLRALRDSRLDTPGH